MRPTIFNDRVATALRIWHHTARKNIKENKKKSGQMTPMSSRLGTPSNSYSLSPVHLLGHYQSNIDTLQNEHSHVDGSPAHIYPLSGHHEIELSYMDQGMDQVQEHGSSEVAL